MVEIAARSFESAPWGQARNDMENNAINPYQCLFFTVRKSTAFLMFSAVGGLFWWVF